MYDRLRDVLGANAKEGIDERFKKLVENPYEDDELQNLMEREHLREQLEPKYVIVKNGPLYEFRARYVDMHRTLLSQQEIRDRLCDGGGFWGVNGDQRLVTLYDSSADFGFPKHIEEAIRQDGHHLLKILERVCGEKDGGICDFSGYEISYMDRQHERHYVEYLSAEDAGKMKLELQTAISREVDEAYQKRLSHEDYERFGRRTNYTPPSSIDKKKRKRKAKQQKQSRRKNRR
jgi:hypothetical protein